MTIIDFDDCHYDFFVHDIAITLFYVTWFSHSFSKDINQESKEAFVKIFLENFLTGYCKYTSLVDTWKEQLQLFLKCKIMSCYIDSYKNWDLDNMNDWQKYVLKRHKQEIEQEINYLTNGFLEKFEVF